MYMVSLTCVKKILVNLYIITLNIGVDMSQMQELLKEKILLKNKLKSDIAKLVSVYRQKIDIVNREIARLRCKGAGKRINQFTRI